LFYTSTLHPYTFHQLREYILHRVLSTPAKSYLFQIKAQTIERDTVLVPSGWDSWGKIKVLREGFDCEHVNEGWDADMDAVTDRQKPGKNGARGTFEEAILDIELDIQVNTPPLFFFLHCFTYASMISLNISLYLPFVKMNKCFMSVTLKPCREQMKQTEDKARDRLVLDRV
jgi:hypothetical protein